MRNPPRKPGFLSEVAGTPSDPFGPALGALAAWRRVAGAQFSRRCPVLRIVSGTLVVGAPHPRWEKEIATRAPGLVADLVAAGLPIRAVRCEPLAEAPGGADPPAGRPALPSSVPSEVRPSEARALPPSFEERFHRAAGRLLARRDEDA